MTPKGQPEKIAELFFNIQTTLDQPSIVRVIHRIKDYFSPPLQNKTILWLEETLSLLNVRDMNKAQFISLIKALEKANVDTNVNDSTIDMITLKYIKKSALPETTVEEIAAPDHKDCTINSILLTPPTTREASPSKTLSSEDSLEFKSLLEDKGDLFLNGERDWLSRDTALERESSARRGMEDPLEKWRLEKAVERTKAQSTTSWNREVKEVMDRIEGIIGRREERAGGENEKDKDPEESPIKKRLSVCSYNTEKEVIRQLSMYEEEFNRKIAQFVQTLEDKMQRVLLSLKERPPKRERLLLLSILFSLFLLLLFQWTTQPAVPY